MRVGSENRSRIISIGTAVPDYAANQETILEFMQYAYHEPVASRKLDVLFQHSGIEKRYSVIPDFSNAGCRMLFPETEEMPPLNERVDIFKEKAVPLALRAVRRSLKNIHSSVADLGITHLITVSCTGLYAPGLDAELMEQLNLPTDIFHTSLNFLGCNAAFPALKIADAMIKSHTDARVLIVCVELCTLHFQPKDNNDNLLSNTIFGDGSAAVIVVSDAYAQKNAYNGFNLKGFYSTLLLNGKDLMGWNLTPNNFEMILNAGLPNFLGKEMMDVFNKMTTSLGFSLKDIRHWAIHPGGKRILDAIKEELYLQNNELCHSYSVLQQYGNMSSPTVLFVLSEILRNEISKGETVLSMGFGPGLSIESLLMTYEST